MTIVVVGAGAGSTDLTARIELIDGKNKVLYLNTNAGTTQTGANVTSVAPSWLQAGMVWLEGSYTYAGATIGDGSSATFTGTLTGAAIGDYSINAAPYTLQGCVATSYVSATDTITVVISNTTGGSKTFASTSTWRVRVIK